MAQPVRHPKTGMYWFRRAVPAALRKSVGKREWLKTLGTKDLTEAKRRYPAVAAECEAAFATARDGSAPELAKLTPKLIASLSGEWLRRELVAHEDDLRTRETWDAWLTELQRAAERAGARPGRDGELPLDERGMVRAVAGDIAQLLEDEGLTLAPDSRQFHELGVALFWRRVTFCNVQQRRLAGDWSSPSELDKVPPWKRAAVNGKTLSWALEAWIAERKPSASTAREYRGIIKQFGADKPLATILFEDVRDFKDKAVKDGWRANTVQKKLGALRTVFAWATENRHAELDPTQGLRVAGLKKDREKSRRLEYTRSDARRVLTAARKEEGELRWLPWLLAATGCRIHEVGQARVADIQRVDGVTFLSVNDSGEDATLKTVSSRRCVPLHPALVSEGFLRYVATLPKDGLLFPDNTPDSRGSWGGNIGKRYNRWAAQIAPGKTAHSWRHSFKTWARDAEVAEDIHDAITGHKGTNTVSRRYGGKLLTTLARAMAKVDFGVPK